jgi:23S rRNA (adenine1618-N6)-methyltransferase
MHLRNIHRYGYDFKKLTVTHPNLQQHIIESPTGGATIDFSNAASILEFNTALLKHHYKINSWRLPDGSIYPPIPGRADYVHHIADLVEKGEKKGLDIGCGASAIYPILGNAIYNWPMVGCDVVDESVGFAKKNTAKNDQIEIRHQVDKGNIFKGVILTGEYYDFTMCNPPFYTSEVEAIKANKSKQRKLGTVEKRRNFAGHSHELWCNGGEALFIKRMIKESVHFKDQVGWFTCLLSRKQHLKNPLKQLEKLKAEHKIVEMTTGQKQSRFIAWRFKSL